jgi:hypothetical protein
VSDRQLTTGEPVPEDGSHMKLRPDGQQEGYVVLTPEERAKGFIQPVRNKYVHKTCGVVTRMGDALSETYARDPWFYSGTFCVGCGTHFPLAEFTWSGTDESLSSLHWSKEKIAQIQAAKKALREHAP